MHLIKILITTTSQRISLGVRAEASVLAGRVRPGRPRLRWAWPEKVASDGSARATSTIVEWNAGPAAHVGQTIRGQDVDAPAPRHELVPPDPLDDHLAGRRVVGQDRGEEGPAPVVGDGDEVSLGDRPGGRVVRVDEHGRAALPRPEQRRLAERRVQEESVRRDVAAERVARADGRVVRGSPGAATYVGSGGQPLRGPGSPSRTPRARTASAPRRRTAGRAAARRSAPSARPRSRSWVIALGDRRPRRGDARRSAPGAASRSGGPRIPMRAGQLRRTPPSSTGPRPPAAITGSASWR